MRRKDNVRAWITLPQGTRSGVGAPGKPQVSVQSTDANLGHPNQNLRHRNQKTGREKNRPGTCPGPVQKSNLARIIE